MVWLKFTTFGTHMPDVEQPGADRLGDISLGWRQRRHEREYLLPTERRGEFMLLQKSSQVAETAVVSLADLTPVQSGNELEKKPPVERKGAGVFGGIFP